MRNISLLNKFSTKNYLSDPFPFFEIENALEENFYNYLKNDYALFEHYFQKTKNFHKNNIRLQICSQEFLNLDIFKKSSWHDFIIYHTSNDFFLELVEIFYEDLNKIYPNVVKIIEKNPKNILNIRSLDNNNNYEFVSDCQPGINTPVTSKSSVRGPHVDNPVELFGGLFYLRDDKDKSSGGDLVLYDKKNDIYFKEKAEVYNVDDLIPFKKILYKKNNAVFFLNTENSIHSITPREITDNCRNLTNLIFERYIDKNKFFELKRKENFANKIIKKIIKKIFIQ
jgi:hypothetical protein